MYHLKDWEQSIRRSKSLLERFEAKVHKEMPEGCWLWTGSINRSGYGSLIIGGYHTKRMTIAAHRLAYELFVARIPDGFPIDHLCRNRRCVNPTHLEPVTTQENVKRGIRRPRGPYRPKHCCPRGHDFTPENTRIQKRSDRPYSQRVCKTCEQVRHKNYVRPP